ncbi:metallophosphoesterase [Taibaiella soli]|uniref:Serine/threonine protein phosphatase n=1 Tax=Taibaiella soli TaxID=1649169 RepID=A0A2W2BDH1_9BACT|nr:metallophosphoesterase [Taibaiella soli]PZF71646.1 serine/threonine protein phosphatase [Taibaiella soli]
MSGNTFVIGDIHGGLKALQQLMDRMQPKENDVLVFLGDYVDGWSEAAMLIDYLMYLDTAYRCIFIKGNHDAWCEEWLRGMQPDDKWLFSGGQATINSYQSFSAKQKRTHLMFFNRMRNYHIDERNRLFIHAGYTSIHGPAQEHHESNYWWDRTLWEMAVAMDKTIPKDSMLFPKRLRHFHEIYVGHTPTLNYNEMMPMQGYNVWNVDTGAAYYGKLSGMNVDTKEVFQSEPVQSFYPNEKGRN